MNDIISIIENIKKTLNQEEIYINKRAKTLDPKCYKKIADILETSR
jgi:16S rRNA A1518/A1519 N6-dimethyltransferase RsmA/KsgA/DIM1 with predicted DNA glycosylase/AP lyase activity